MYLYVELWKARDEWSALSRKQRADYLEWIMSSVQGTKDAGARLIGCALNESDTPSRADYTYVAAWTMESREAVEHQDETFRTSGLLDYFEQVNARGRVITVEELMRHQTESLPG